MNRTELATMIENKWMEYNAAVVSRLHPTEVKTQLANIMINNATVIIKALRETPVEETETSDVITGDAGEPPKKVRRSNGERKI